VSAGRFRKRSQEATDGTDLATARMLQQRGCIWRLCQWHVLHVPPTTTTTTILSSQSHGKAG
jgi:hypothetical protein